MTLLQTAVHAGNLKSVKYLVARKASTLPTDIKGHYVDAGFYFNDPDFLAKPDSKEIIEIVTKRCNDELIELEAHPVWEAIRKHENDKLLEIIAKSPEVLIFKNRKWEDLLICAVKSGNIEAAKMLLAKGGKWGQDKNGYSARHYAKEMFEIFEKDYLKFRLKRYRDLKKRGIPMDSLCDPETGKTELMKAAENLEYRLVVCLVGNGADPLRKDKQGKNAYDYLQNAHQIMKIKECMDKRGKFVDAGDLADEMEKILKNAKKTMPINLSKDN